MAFGEISLSLTLWTADGQPNGQHKESRDQYWPEAASAADDGESIAVGRR